MGGATGSPADGRSVQPHPRALVQFHTHRGLLGAASGGGGFGGRGAHGSLDLVEESKTSHKHPRPNRRHSAVRGANRANCEICRSANLRPTYRNSLGRMDLSMGFLFHEISRSYRALSSIGPQDDAHAAARALGIHDFYCKWHDVFLRGSAARAPLLHDRPSQAQPRPAPPRPAPSLLSANAGPLVAHPLR